MNRELFDTLVAIVTILWFLWLIAWPYAAVVGSIAWGFFGGLFLWRGRQSLGLLCLVVAAAVLGAGLVVFLEAENMVIGVLPSSLRPAGQFVFLSVPLVAWIVGLFWIAAAVWHRGRIPNRTIDADRLPASLRSPANGRSS